MVADRERITRLLKTARGQIDGILRMVEEDRYCMDVSNQILASRAILDKANKAVIKAHLFHCVAKPTGESQEKLQEINDLIDKLI